MPARYGTYDYRILAPNQFPGSGGPFGTPMMNPLMRGPMMPGAPQPLAVPGGDLGPPQPTSSFNLGGALKSAIGGAGNAIGRGVDWLTDEKQGLLRQMLLSQGIGTIANLYAANQQGKREDEERERRRSSARGVAPQYGKLLRELSQR